MTGKHPRQSKGVIHSNFEEMLVMIIMIMMMMVMTMSGYDNNNDGDDRGAKETSRRKE